MNTQTLNLISKKLQDAPQDILDRVSEYVDALIQPEKKPYLLTSEQQNILDFQTNINKSTYINADELYKDLRNKYDL